LKVWQAQGKRPLACCAQPREHPECTRVALVGHKKPSACSGMQYCDLIDAPIAKRMEQHENASGFSGDGVGDGVGSRQAASSSSKKRWKHPPVCTCCGNGPWLKQGFRGSLSWPLHLAPGTLPRLPALRRHLVAHFMNRSACNCMNAARRVGSGQMCTTLTDRAGSQNWHAAAQRCARCSATSLRWRRCAVCWRRGWEQAGGQLEFQAAVNRTPRLRTCCVEGPWFWKLVFRGSLFGAQL